MELQKEKPTPVERIPAEWYGPLNNFLGRNDPSDLTVEVLENIVTEEELGKYKNLWSRESQLTRQEDEEMIDLADKIVPAAERVIKKINPKWPKHR